MQIYSVDKDNLSFQFSGGRFGAVGMQSEATGRGLGCVPLLSTVKGYEPPFT